MVEYHSSSFWLLACLLVLGCPARGEEVIQTVDNEPERGFAVLGYRNLADATIAIQRAACRILSFRHPELVISLVHDLVTRSLDTDSISDLRDAAWLLREVRSQPASVEIELDVYWDNLATAFRYHLIDLEDATAIDDCIRCTEAALSLRPKGHPERHESLHNLAVLRDDRLEMKRDVTDNPDEALDSERDARALERIIMLHEEVLSLRPEGHPGRGDTLQNLAMALTKQHNQTHELAYLELSIQYLRDLLATLSDDQSGRAPVLNHLASNINSLGRLTRDEGHAKIREGMELFEACLYLLPFDHPARTNSLNNMARSYFDRAIRG